MTASLHSGRWRATAAAMAIVAMFGAAACEYEEAKARPDPHVWVVDLYPEDQGAVGPRATVVGGRHEVTMRLVVFATACAPEVYENLADHGGGYGHLGCLTDLDLAAVDDRFPYLRARELTATAHVTIVAEHGPEEVKTLLSRDVGPLTMGEPVVLAPVTWRFDPSPDPHSIYARISACRLSNGAACGNSGRRFFVDPPGTDGLGLTIPDRAGGLTGIEMGSGRETGRTNPPDQRRPVGGVPVRRTVQGLYRTGGGPGRVFFWGVELAEPQSPQAVERSGPAIVKDAFDVAVNSARTFVPRSEMRPYNAGPLGGQVWCLTFRHVLLGETAHACGWVDRSTVGVISVGRDAIKDLGLTEANVAALLVRMRADIETRRP